jgi:hypothetical protein
MHVKQKLCNVLRAVILFYFDEGDVEEAVEAVKQ